MSSVRDGDLRSEAKDRRRVKTHNTKWSRGAVPAPGKYCNHNPLFSLPCADCSKRPWNVERPITFTPQYVSDAKQRAHNMQRRGFRSDANQAVDEYSDSSAAEELDGSSAADEIMYSFDARTGPGHGSQILSHAIGKAVERYENKETEKIVREYDLVADGRDELHFDNADDDFELVDSSQL